MAENNGVKLPWRAMDFLSGAYYSIGVTTVLIGVAIYIISLRADLSEYLRDQTYLVRRLDDIDLHGSRVLPLVEQRITIMDDRITELSRRASSIEAFQHQLDLRVDLLNERQQEVLRRLERLDHINGRAPPP